MKSRSVLVRAALATALMTAALSSAPARAETSAGRLQGIVENASGEPLAGASVRLTDRTGAVAATVMTDPAGHYVADVAPGTYDLAIDHGTGKTEKHARVADVEVGADTPLDIAIAGNSVRPSVLSGRLVDGSGQPLSAVMVDVDFQETVTDADGRFALAVRPDRYEVALRFQGQDSDLRIVMNDFDLTTDRTVNWTIPLATVDVLVHDAGGTLWKGFRVDIGVPGSGCPGCSPAQQAFPGGPPGGWSAGAYSDAAGRVRMPALAVPDAKLSVTAYQWEDRRSTVAVKAPSTSFDVEVRPKAASQPPVQTVQLQGLAVDAAGQPLSSVTLENANGVGTVAWAEIDAAGQYRLNAPPGKYILSAKAYHEDNTPGHESWDDAQIELLDFRLDHDGQRQDLRTAGTTTRIRVLDPGGAPVGGAFVNAEYRPTTGTGGDLYSGKWRVSALAVVTTAADGTAVVPTVAGVEGSYEVSPPAARGLPTKGKIPADAPGVDVSLTAGVRVEARLRDPAGAARDVDHVWLRNAAGEPTQLTPSGGGVYAAQVAAGQYVLGIDGSPDREGESEDIDDWSIGNVAVDATRDTVLDLTVPAEIRAGLVRFVDSAGRPYDAAAELRATTAPGALTLGPGLKGTGTAVSSYMGEVDSFSPPLVAPVKVTIETMYPYELKLSSLPLAPGGQLVIAFPSGSTPLAPSQVTCLQGTATGPASASIRWSPPADDFGSPVTGYLVTNELPNGERAQQLVPPSVTSLDLTGLRPGNRFFIVVEPVNVNGIGQLDALNLVSPDGSEAQPCPPPGAPGTPGGPGPGGSGPGGGGPGASPPDSGSNGAGGPGSSGRTGYWALARDGHVYNFGDAPALGNGAVNAVDLEPTPTGAGYWLLQSNGRVSSFGDATALGNVDTGKLAKGEEPASLSATPTGKGYWVFTNRGRVFAFGDAALFGDLSSTKLNGPVLGSVATPSGRGYYMVASDGGIFTFGDATFLGSMGGQRLNAPVQDLVPDADGRGYWLVASDGGIFAFDAPFRGSMGGQKLNKPVSGMVRYGDGYLMVGADGGIFNFSTRPFAGSLGDRPPASPIVAVAAMP